MKNLVILFMLLTSINLSAQEAITLDTIRISRLDTAFVMKLGGVTHRPCQKPRFVTYYKMKESVPDAYYIIVDEEDKIRRAGNFKEGISYDEITYYYNKSSRLTSVIYMEEGRHVRTEVLDRNRAPKIIRYYSKKSSNVIKEEFYTHGKLKKVRNYYGFANSYRTTHY